MRHDTLIVEMMRFFSGDVRRISHFLKVYAYAQIIGLQERIPQSLQTIVETAAITHDIGIRVSEEKFGKSTAELQQTEGPPAARELLTDLHCSPEVIDRVCHIISLHHTYSAIDGIDFQILAEADLLVNLDEGNASPDQIISMRNSLFRTETGIRFCDLLFQPPAAAAPDAAEAEE